MPKATKKLKECIKLSSGCKILLHPVNSPELYGVATLKKIKNNLLKGEA